MSPISSEYICFIDSQTTVTTKPWYHRVSKLEADKKVEVWRKAWIITGSDLRDLGLEVSDDDLTSFFNLGEDPKLQQHVIKAGVPRGNLVFEAYISTEN
jgi:hypothetical protein